MADGQGAERETGRGPETWAGWRAGQGQAGCAQLACDGGGGRRPAEGRASPLRAAAQQGTEDRQLWQGSGAQLRGGDDRKDMFAGAHACDPLAEVGVHHVDAFPHLMAQRQGMGGQGGDEPGWRCSGRGADRR